MPDRGRSEALQSLRAEYDDHRRAYQRFCTELTTQLDELIRNAGVTPALPIQSRVKTWISIEKKCESHGRVPEKLSEIPDVAGLRVVLLFERDIDTVAGVVEANLEIIRKEDTRERLGVGEFGYGSIHYHAAPPEGWLSVPTLSQLGGIRGEIQVRTVSQHIWAAASHVLQYKQETDVPKPLRRAINRAAALLEVVDLEFERVLAQREEYLDTGAAAADEELNTESLKVLLEEIWPPENRSDGEEYSIVLDELQFFGFDETGRLREFLKKHREATLRDEARQVGVCLAELRRGEEISGAPESRVRAGVYYTHTGLTRIAMGIGLDGFDEYLKKKHTQ